MSKSNLEQQIRNAQKALASWPEWMKRAGHFAGSETKDSASGGRSDARS